MDRKFEQKQHDASIELQFSKLNTQQISSTLIRSF